MPRGFHLLIAAQFASGLADNALLIVAIALLPQWGLPGWVAPLLKFSFTLAYVFGAPFVGAFADAWPKRRVMMWMNGVKVLGLLMLFGGAHPLVAFAVLGLGAAVYAPAKYGLATELVGPSRLVAANAWMEVAMVGAILLGTVTGGVLAVGDRLPWALPALLAIYALSALLNLGVADSGVAPVPLGRSPRRLFRQFRRANRVLWRDGPGGLSLAATTLFWGAGATLQFAVLGWATDRLGLALDRAAMLQAVVAVGVVFGAVAAGRFVALHDAPRVLPCGVALGLLVPAIAWTSDVAVAIPLLVLAGVFGGLLVVPMNALLQHRGALRLSAGRSIAVQNFNENASVMVMTATYAGLLALDLPHAPVMSAFGLLVAGAVALLISRSRGRNAGAAGPGAAQRR
jgi:MFS transporter, LPLT family, lysophospholipid transporter